MYVSSQARIWIRWLLEPLQMLVLAQAGFIVLGMTYLEFDVGLADILAAIVGAVATEFAASYYRARKEQKPFRIFVPTSALAAALGIVIFFRAVNPFYFAVAAALAILSKYVIRASGTHVFNPSNFGIVALVFLAPFATTIEFTQWGSDPTVYAAIAIICLFIAHRAGVLVTTLSFLASYALVLVLAVSISKDAFILHHYGLIGPSLILFASFMITDPRTSPRGFYQRVLHGVSVTCAYFFLESIGVRYALFVASFIVTAANVILPGVAASFARESVFTRIRNAPTALLFFVLVTGGFVHLLASPSVRFAPIVPSLGFLVMGVEARELLACPDSAILRPQPLSGLATDRFVTGAAWGDYDGNGYDDLFISSFRSHGTLFRNEGDGTFTDATADTGLPHVSVQGGYFADYDNDRDLDFFMLSPGKPDVERDVFERARLALTRHESIRVYKNEGGSFNETTKEAGFISEYPPMQSASFADFDADGMLDMVAVSRSLWIDLRAGQNRAMKKAIADPFIKRGTNIVCGAEALTLISAHDDIRESLEALVGVETFTERNGCFVISKSIDTAVASPLEMDSASLDIMLSIPGSAHFFKNVGSRFVEVESFRELVEDVVAGHANEPSHGAMHEGDFPYHRVLGKFFQPVSLDYDGDGRMDVLLTSDFGSNLLLRQTDSLIFEDATVRAGLDYYATGMGAAWSDLDRDGLHDLVVTNSLTDFIFRNVGDGTFENVSAEHELAGVGIGWGVAALDYDLDGFDDLYIANGDNTRTFQETDPALQRPLLRQDNLYRNLAGEGFEDRTGIDVCADTAAAFPLATSDYDTDGDPDLFVGNVGSTNDSEERSFLLENSPERRDANYLGIRLSGERDNAFGVGARVTVTTEGSAQTKIVGLGESYHAQHSLALLFGLGQDAARSEVRVRWPSGDETVVRDVEPDQYITIRQ